MFEPIGVMHRAQAFATHASLRQQAISGNIANADTPGYRAQDVLPFAEYLDRMPRSHAAPPPRPQDLLLPDPTPATLSPDGNGVSLEHEMIRAAAARSQHETALGIYSSARDLLRASLGR